MCSFICICRKADTSDKLSYEVTLENPDIENNPIPRLLIRASGGKCGVPWFGTKTGKRNAEGSSLRKGDASIFAWKITEWVLILPKWRKNRRNQEKRIR